MRWRVQDVPVHGAVWLPRSAGARRRGVRGAALGAAEAIGFHGEVRAMKNSSLAKRIAVDNVYDFLKRSFRQG